MSICLATKGVLRDVRRLGRTIDRVVGMTAVLSDPDSVTGVVSYHTDIVGVVDNDVAELVGVVTTKTSVVGFLVEDGFEGVVK